LAETGLPPAVLRLEITEHTVMKDIEKAITMMIVLRNIGVRLSIDDFGTGYSSLHYLKSFPLDEIKIDKSFVKDIPTHRDDVAIAKAIFSLAHSMDMKVLAEGVETLTQLEFMREHRCDGMQGFLFSKPVSAEEFTALLKEGRKLQI
jgi:EAL domain-containing protein (putative c-di-GMP-specific phosphodiesterase class I)